MLIPFTHNTLLCLAILLPFNIMATPLFDVHLHFNEQDAKQFTPEQIINTLQQQNIKHAVITSRPPLLIQRLYKLAPDRIIPLLGIYQTHNDKANWPHDAAIADSAESTLRQNIWLGIGEIHITTKDRHSPVFHRIIKLAVQYKLPLLLHTDPAVIDTVYDIAPGHPVIWAHAGTFPYPDLLANYLQRYPALHADLSVRDERITPNGEISNDWYDLFIQFPDRFMIGVDTYSLSRWKNFDKVIVKIRHWLDQLPEEVATKLKYKNAERLFIQKALNIK